MSTFAGNTVHVFQECQLSRNGESKLAEFVDLEAEESSLFGRKICGQCYELPAGTSGLLQLPESAVPFSALKSWHPDAAATPSDQLPQLLRYQEYITRMHLS